MKSTIIFIVFIFSSLLLSSQIVNSDTITEDIEPLLIEPCYPVVPDFDVKSKPFLRLSDSLQDFNYTGLIYCNVIIDSFTKTMWFDSVAAIDMQNNTGDTIFIIFEQEEYQYPDFLLEILPYIKNFIANIPLKGDNKYKNSMYRYYILSFPLLIE